MVLKKLTRLFRTFSLQIFIPRTLIEVAHPERDAKAVMSANFDDTSQDNKADKSKLLAPYQAVTGVQVNIWYKAIVHSTWVIRESA